LKPKNVPAPRKQTQWHVITGPPCSGKTAVIDELANRGYQVVPEVARAYIDSQLSRGVTLSQIKANPLAFERNILMEKVRIENKLPFRRTVFLDRAVPDSIAYFRFEGLDPSEPVALSRTHRYATVFLFEALPFEKDRVRSENPEAADRLAAMLIDGYRDMGYHVVAVPVMPIVQRVRFVLRHARIHGAD
jgi:predicted ATPase